jgi:hypothetical protein
MLQSIEYLFNNQKLHDDLTTIGQFIRNRNGLRLAAEKIE